MCTYCFPTPFHKGLLLNLILMSRKEQPLLAYSSPSDVVSDYALARIDHLKSLEFLGSCFHGCTLVSY